MNSASNMVLTFFALFWTGTVLLVDGFLAVPALWQVQAEKFPTTAGVIRSSRVIAGSDSDGDPKLSFALTYSYQVDEQNYTGTRYRYLDIATPDDGAAARVAASLQVGREVMVHYHPRRPSDAILQTGLEGGDLLVFTFLAPFNLAALAFCVAAWTSGRRSNLVSPFNRIRILPARQPPRIRFAVSPWVAALVAAIVLCLLGLFAVVLFFGDYHPTFTTMAIVWTIIVAGSISTGWLHHWRASSGRYDLVIDAARGWLELPAIRGRKSARRIPFDDLVSLEVDTIATRDADGDTSMVYIPTLHFTGSEPGLEQLARLHRVEDARELARWVRTQVRLPLRPSWAQAIDYPPPLPSRRG